MGMATRSSKESEFCELSLSEQRGRLQDRGIRTAFCAIVHEVDCKSACRPFEVQGKRAHVSGGFGDCDSRIDLGKTSVRIHRTKVRRTRE
jgi:hypothetical protein